MEKLVFILRWSLISILLVGYCSCKPKVKVDTSYLESESEYSEYDDSYEEEPIPVDNSIKIAYSEMYGNTITIPVKINGMSLDMIFDTGASSTCITLAEAQYLYEKGNLEQDDIIDTQQFQTADGNISTGLRIILRDVLIGDKINLYNIEALVVENQQAPLLLGQSVLKNFREISIDRENKVIKFIE